VESEVRESRGLGGETGLGEERLEDLVEIAVGGDFLQADHLRVSLQKYGDFCRQTSSVESIFAGGTIFIISLAIFTNGDFIVLLEKSFF
jgi:hypothetical protein